MSSTHSLYRLTAKDKAFQLKLLEEPTPTPGAGQVLVRVHACSLNYRDLIGIRNLAGRKMEGRVPLSDGAGEVVAVGSDVNRVAVGDKVAGCFYQSWVGGKFELKHHSQDLGGSIDGMLSRYVLLSAGGVVKIPLGYSYEEAACLPCAAVTAWYSLFTRGNLQRGETVLILGTGGVSIFAIQFAAAHGAKCIVTSSSDAKLVRAKEMGAAITINYKTTPDWEKEVWRLTEKKGADHIIETGGGGTLGKSLNCLAAEGQIALIGVLTGFGPPSDSLFPLMARNARINGIYVGSRAEFEAMNQFLEKSDIRPVIDKVFSFEQANEAYNYLESGSHLGKVVIRVQ